MNRFQKTKCLTALGALIALSPCSALASKSTCPDKTFDVQSIEGVYQGNECGDLCWSSLKLDNGEVFSFIAGEEEMKAIGATLGKRVSIMYEVQQFWMDEQKECMRMEVYKSGKKADSPQPSGDLNHPLVREVRESTLTAYPQTTIGKALEGSFTHSVWLVQETKKGVKRVSFKGAISEQTHKTAVNALLEAVGSVHGGAMEKAVAKNSLLVVFMSMYGGDTKKADQEFGPPTAGVSKEDHLLHSLLKKMYWPVGGEILFEFQFTADTSSFAVSKVVSDAIQTKDIKEILDVVYE